jgi:hypothetical protein
MSANCCHRAGRSPVSDSDADGTHTGAGDRAGVSGPRAACQPRVVAIADGHERQPASACAVAAPGGEGETWTDALPMNRGGRSQRPGNPRRRFERRREVRAPPPRGHAPLQDSPGALAHVPRRGERRRRARAAAVRDRGGRELPLKLHHHRRLPCPSGEREPCASLCRSTRSMTKTCPCGRGQDGGTAAKSSGRSFRTDCASGCCWTGQIVDRQRRLRCLMAVRCSCRPECSSRPPAG